MKFNIAHIVPSEKTHTIHGYDELIETVMWGLAQLGHEVTYHVNRVTPDSRNIVFGALFLDERLRDQLPLDTVVYNLEQFRNGGNAALFAATRSLASRFEIWDYSPFNADAWSTVELRMPVKLVPVGYAPILERIGRAPEQEIDALLYGSTNELRLSAFDAIARARLKTVFAAGLYGPTRDALIGRSRTVLNMSYFTSAKIFEVVRVSYLLANRKAVVSIIDPDTAIEADLRPAIAPAAATNLVEVIERLVEDDAARRELEERGHEIFRKRDVRRYLEAALG